MVFTKAEHPKLEACLISKAVNVFFEVGHKSLSPRRCYASSFNYSKLIE